MIHLGGEPGGRTGHDRSAGVHLGDHAGGHRDIGHGDGDTDGEIRDVHGDDRGDVSGLGLDGDGLERMVDDPATTLDGLGLAEQLDRDVDGHRRIGIHPQEVDMEHVATDRVTLEVLDDGEIGLTIDIEGDEGVDAGLGGQHPTQVGPGHGHRHGVAAEAVDDSGDATVGAQTVRGAGTGGAARCGGEGEIHVRYS